MRVMARYELAALDPGNRLAAEYPAAFFPFRPEDAVALARRPRVGADPAAVSAALTALQESLGADAAAVANARRLADPATPVVTVGQQPGLLTGPLYTIYKALTAITLARQLGAVPVFWVGADDDDRAEVDHCAVWDARGRPTALHYPDTAGLPGQLVGDLPVENSGREVLDALAPLLAGLPHAEATLSLLAETLAESVDFGDWFARLLARLLSPLGLVVCDPRLPALRTLTAEIARRELREPLRTTALVNDAARRLRDAGYMPPLTKPDE